MEKLMPRLQQYVRQLRPRNESHVNHVDRIQSLLTEGGSTAGATEMESHIVIAYNGGYENAPDTYDVEKESYEKSKHISEAIAKDIQNKTKASPKSMIHFGKGSGVMVDWWKGNATPKTDLYSTDGINISLKQRGGSQLMSGLHDETKSTFRAATEYMDDNAPKEVEQLVNSLGKVLKNIEVQGNINSIAKAIKTKVVPKQIVAKQGKKMVTINIDRKKYEQEMQNMVDWKSEMKQTGIVFKEFFENNYEFKKWFCYEAATGETKFRPDKYANSNWVVEFDPKTGKNNKINQLSIKNNVPSPYIKEITKKARIRIAPKTGSGSKVRLDLTARTSGSLRIDIKDEFLGGNSYLKENEDTFTNFMEKSFKEFTNSFLLTEEPLTEIRLFNRIKKWFKDISIKLLQKVKQLAVKGIRFILDFFEFQIDRIKTSGLEMFGYK
tara:strand:+ start:843 stop:2156 length:1314 start_codon:yes stop_codon:yes gene_type:complete